MSELHLTDAGKFSGLGFVLAGREDRFSLLPVDDAAEWSRLLEQLPFPHLPQSHAYGMAKGAKNWMPKRVLIRDGGRAVALATVLERRVAGLRVLARVNRGPVFFAAMPQERDVVGAYRALRRGWRGPLSIATALPKGEDSDRLLREAGLFRIRAAGWTSGRIDLRMDEEALWRSFASGFRNRLRQSEKAGAEVRIARDGESFEWMIARHLDNMKEKGFSAADAVMLRTLRAANPEDVTVFQLLDGDRAVAGMSVVQFGKAAEYHVGWFGPDGRRLNAGNALMWATIREMKRRGLDYFDVGGMRAGDGYTQFKRTMRPREYSLAGEWGSF